MKRNILCVSVVLIYLFWNCAVAEGTGLTTITCLSLCIHMNGCMRFHWWCTGEGWAYQELQEGVWCCGVRYTSRVCLTPLNWRRKQAPSWKQDSILGRTVDFELYAQYLWKRHTNWKSRLRLPTPPPPMEEPQLVSRLCLLKECPNYLCNRIES